MSHAHLAKMGSDRNSISLYVCEYIPAVGMYCIGIVAMDDSTK